MFSVKSPLIEMGSVGFSVNAPYFISRDISNKQAKHSFVSMMHAGCTKICPRHPQSKVNKIKLIEKLISAVFYEQLIYPDIKIPDICIKIHLQLHFHFEVSKFIIITYYIA